jgi:hypothetical protein
VLRAIPRNDRILLIALFSIALWLYLATLCRSVYWYDSAEYVTAAYTLGVPHPPGYPLYTLLAHTFLWLPLEPALAVNAMSALFGALAVALCYASSRVLGAGRAAAVAGALLLLGSPSFWHNATIAEVYTPGLCFAFGVLLLLLLARDRERPRFLVWAAALGGAGMGVHYSLATLGLGFALLAAEAAARGAPAGLRAGRIARLLGQCALAAVLSYTCAFSYVALRAGSDVVPNQAAPFSVARFLWLLSGGNYKQWFLHDELGARALHALQLVAGETSAVGAMLGALGIASLALGDRGRALAMLLALAGNLLVFFRYRVDDLEVFFLPSVALLCASAGVGAQALANRLALLAKPGRAAAYLPLILCGVGTVRCWQGFEAHDLSRFAEASDYGARLTVQLPYNAAILNYTTPEEWKRDAVFGMYFQHVLGRRRDVVVAANADRPILDRLLSEGRPTYLYAPVAHVAREYLMVPDGDLYRLVRRR